MPDGAQGVVARARRHDIVTIAPACAAQMTAQGATPEDRDAIAHWMRAAWPMIVRMQPPGLRAAGRLAVGAPLPLSQRRRKLALQVESDWVARIAPPPQLCDIADSLPSRFCAPLHELALHAARAGIALRAFGSAAWQALTGAAYLTSSSDLDILWAPADRRELDEGVALLAAWATSSDVPLDGEIVFGERAVSLREWRQPDSGASLLVKRLHGVALCTRGELIESLATAGSLACAR